MQLSKEEYAWKWINNGCLVWIKNSITQDNCLESLSKPCDAEQAQVMPNSYLRDGIFNPHLTTIKDSYSV